MLTNKAKILEKNWTQTVKIGMWTGPLFFENDIGMGATSSFAELHPYPDQT